MIGTWGQVKEPTFHIYLISKYIYIYTLQLLVTYCSFVQDLDGIRASHTVFLQGLFQFLQGGVVPLSKHHKVNITKKTNKKQKKQQKN